MSNRITEIGKIKNMLRAKGNFGNERIQYTAEKIYNFKNKNFTELVKSYEFSKGITPPYSIPQMVFNLYKKSKESVSNKNSVVESSSKKNSNENKIFLEFVSKKKETVNRFNGYEGLIILEFDKYTYKNKNSSKTYELEKKLTPNELSNGVTEKYLENKKFNPVVKYGGKKPVKKTTTKKLTTTKKPVKKTIPKKLTTTKKPFKKTTPKKLTTTKKPVKK